MNDFTSGLGPHFWLVMGQRAGMLAQQAMILRRLRVRAAWLFENAPARVRSHG